MKLNAEETALIVARRAENRQALAQQALTIKALRIATRYASWLEKQKMGTSYSTFIEGFGYQDGGGQEMYRIVTELLKVARTIHC